jgi:hypothetical protein
VALDSPAESSRHHFDAVRGLGHLDSGVQQVPEYGADSGWIRLYGALRKNSDHIHPVRAWVILYIFSASGAVTTAALVTRGGHW